MKKHTRILRWNLRVNKSKSIIVQEWFASKCLAARIFQRDDSKWFAAMFKFILGENGIWIDLQMEYAFDGVRCGLRIWTCTILADHDIELDDGDGSKASAQCTIGKHVDFTQKKTIIAFVSHDLNHNRQRMKNIEFLNKSNLFYSNDGNLFSTFQQLYGRTAKFVEHSGANVNAKRLHHLS